MAKTKGKGKGGSKTGQPKVSNAVKQQAPSETQKALSIVEQGPRDNTIREDGYGGNVGSGSTSFYSSISNYTDDFFNSFKGKGGLIPDFKSFNLTSLAGIKDAFNKVAHLDVNKIKSDFEHSVLGGRSIESIMALPKKLKENPFGTVEEFFGAKSIGGVNVGEWAKKAGMSYKEASHFLRNVGFGQDIAILDRHILKNLVKLEVIDELPKTLTPKLYLEIEEKMRNYCEFVKIPMDEMDLLLWYKEAGVIFK